MRSDLGARDTGLRSVDPCTAPAPYPCSRSKRCWTAGLDHRMTSAGSSSPRHMRPPGASGGFLTSAGRRGPAAVSPEIGLETGSQIARALTTPLSR